MGKRKFTIEQARILGGYNQIEMAEALGMSEKTYINHEKYRRVFKMDVGYLFARLVGMTVDDIIFFDPELRKKCS
jgi:DNA-binding XRE family transcriptional regulator